MNYKLVVTGHSLGAGTAVILSMLLKNAFPGLHCYSFGTPGSVVDELTCKGKLVCNITVRMKYLNIALNRYLILCHKYCSWQ